MYPLSKLILNVDMMLGIDMKNRLVYVQEFGIILTVDSQPKIKKTLL